MGFGGAPLVNSCRDRVWLGSVCEYRYLFLLTARRTYFQTNLIYLDSLRELRTAATAIEGNL
jgi:hypothetical protein